MGKECSICGEIIPKGLARHETVCNMNRANRRQALEHAYKRRKKSSVDTVGIYLLY
jgi:hypothetical protein